MKKCKGGRPHSPVVQKDPDVKNQTCAESSVWTPEGNRDVWLCCHHVKCRNCKRVVSELVHCPDKPAGILQDRRWR